ncbi:fimbrial protein (plasmid) [Klebsiella michiganensis]|uniref:fimbrial protein n=1 Tax=Klebsiella michiganensis TaxID=1134687 RepID=UPI00265AA0D4|nr:fimbrial protein [Klebsiella michiganensis]WKJ95772.1 fimbrial protein [Klebsiella michiganensis]WKK00964.1 fimbrial protein [Klebsiella michiganensis]WKK02882.1 fimbrial protein [Klebsiella michiganensis]WKK06997.1 fimbrial protein [Klebsiella michiganensis]
MINIKHNKFLFCSKYFILFALAIQSMAYADTCSLSTSSVYQYFPATTVYLGRDAAVGDVVGPWISASSIPGWTCTRTSQYTDVAVENKVQGYPPYTKIGTISLDGDSYSWYALGGASPALGYIIRWRAVIDGEYTEWTPLTSNAGVYQNPDSTVSITKSTGESYTIGVETQLRFVKRTSALVAGYSQRIVDAIYVRPQLTYNSTTILTGANRLSQMTAGTATFEGGGTCTTPDVTVTLPDTPVSEFTGIGSTAAQTAFELAFNNCPAGLSSIDYSFATTTSMLDSTQGVVALSSDSTASGVGIQLLSESGSAIQMETSYSLDEYDTEDTGSYTVSLLAGLYQTSANVSAGSAVTAITFTASYK